MWCSKQCCLSAKWGSDSDSFLVLSHWGSDTAAKVSGRRGARGSLSWRPCRVIRLDPETLSIPSKIHMHTHAHFTNTHSQMVLNTFRPSTLRVLFLYTQIEHTHTFIRHNWLAYKFFEQQVWTALGHKSPAILNISSIITAIIYISICWSLLWSCEVDGGFGEREQCMLGMMHAGPEAFWEAAPLQAWPLKQQHG